MEHDNVSMYDAFVYNWSKSVVCDDVIFIASCINDAIGDKIWWPTTQEQVVLNTNLVELQGCIGFIYGTLINIHKPWNDGAHKVWFNGQKNIYSMDNIVVVDHRGLFIYLNSITMMSPFCVSLSYIRICIKFFLRGDEYVEYLLGDLGYLSEEMFITRRIGRCEIGLNDD